jgi:hypothetical protein
MIHKHKSRSVAINKYGKASSKLKKKKTHVKLPEAYKLMVGFLSS